MDRTDVWIRFYDGSIKPVLGQSQMICYRQSKEYSLLFQIVEGQSDQPPLISAEASERLQLVKRNFLITADKTMKAGLQGLATKETILKESRQVFDGLGCLAGECAIEVDTTVWPVQQTPRVLDE